MPGLRRAAQLVEHLGPGWALFRARYAIRKRSGALVRRSPVASWPECPMPADAIVPPFFPAVVRPGEGGVVEADAVCAGRFRLFSRHEVDTGLPPDWHRNPLTGERVPAEVHWSCVGDFAHGDIKAIWELSRFPWAFALGRAFARTNEPRYAETFWVLLEDWMRHNPPNRGAQWMCGQEATFRLMAATFARFACDRAASTTPARMARFQSLALATGRRIAANLDYALSQSNNHGVSECVGLITAGLLTASGAESAAWERRGFAGLRRQLDELVYPDGGFAQHSANYHRVMLDDLLWLMTILRATGRTAPAWLTVAARRALAFIADLMNPATGRVPLYGANDGANILPLADADYRDFRPLVQAGAAVVHGERWLPAGPWDEAAHWLAGSVPEKVTPREWLRTGHWPDAGIAQLRSGDSRLVLRCPARFRHRPGQADLLHAEIEWRGRALALDAGTYGYNAPGAFSGALSEAAVHNSITFDGGEPMTKVSRFLYLPWPHGEVRTNRAGEFEATHDGWSARSLGHTRKVESPAPDVFVVEDRVDGAGRHRARMHWLLADEPHELDATASRIVLRTERGNVAISWEAPASATVTLVRADAASSRGWWSPYYLKAEPALSLAVEFDFEGSARVVTRFAPA